MTFSAAVEQTKQTTKIFARSNEGVSVRTRRKYKRGVNPLGIYRSFVLGVAAVALQLKSTQEIACLSAFVNVDAVVPTYVFEPMETLLS